MTKTTTKKSATTTAPDPAATPDVATAQEQFLEGIRQGQDALVEAVRVWAEAAAKTTTPAPLPEQPADLPRPADLVAGSFDFAEKLLADQRAFAERLVAAAAPVTAGA